VEFCRRRAHFWFIKALPGNMPYWISCTVPHAIGNSRTRRAKYLRNLRILALLIVRIVSGFVMRKCRSTLAVCAANFSFHVRDASSPQREGTV
jgi:hypothetical protein